MYCVVEKKTQKTCVICTIFLFEKVSMYTNCLITNFNGKTVLSSQTVSTLGKVASHHEWNFAPDFFEYNLG